MIFGFLAVALPDATRTTFLALFWLFIIGGVILFLLLATTSLSDESLFWFGLSAVLVVIGALSFLAPSIVTVIFVLIIAGIAFYSGFSDISYLLERPKTMYYLVPGMFLAGIILLAILLRYFPTTNNDLVLTILGTFSFVFGLSSVFIGLFTGVEKGVPPQDISAEILSAACDKRDDK
jgi:uncharacterized membrane protein HdeD (DUF308 family)